ncbi:MAG TPA: ATP-binding protein [Polyangiaceae bacterium]|nr:ATP-binding protein [Polyangiaceae bacterium]
MAEPERFEAEVNPGKEIAEIAGDFQEPREVLREAIHNAYDAAATRFELRAYPETLPAGDRVLSLEFRDDGRGMDAAQLKHFFGLGFSKKDAAPDRAPIGFKGHGTKIFYQARRILVLTQQQNGERLLAVVEGARSTIYQKAIPVIELSRNGDASARAGELQLKLAADHGTTIRLVDYTANSKDLIDSFARRHVDDYVRWFTVYGSFRPALEAAFESPLTLELQATDESAPRPVEFGHPWPKADRTSPRELRALDQRRPYGYFCKRFATRERAIGGGYRISVVALFEGRRGRLERDRNIRRQGAGGIYHESERYGLWLCKDFIPIERRFEWLTEDGCPLLEDGFDLNLSQPLILTNCQDFALTANRGSVGNSSDDLLDAVKKGIYDYLKEIRDDAEYKKFRDEYREDLFARLREKDRAALDRRVERYNRKKLLRATLPGGRPFEFFEPQREITLFGLVAQLQVLAPELLELEPLDYDDHAGIDLLVRRARDPHDLLSRDKVAYAEFKFILEPSINHPFANLSTILCWECSVGENAPVTDPTNERLLYSSARGADGVTRAHLGPEAGSSLTHVIRVIELKGLLRERCALEEMDNPRPVAPTNGRSGAKRRRH